MPSDPATDADDFAVRELCPDGACIGVIGEDGRCPQCGRAGTGAPGAKPVPSPVSVPVPSPVAATDDFASRALCPDGACIGVLGADRRCPVCGAAADA